MRTSCGGCVFLLFRAISRQRNEPSSRRFDLAYNFINMIFVIYLILFSLSSKIDLKSADLPMQRRVGSYRRSVIAPDVDVVVFFFGTMEWRGTPVGSHTRQQGSGHHTLPGANLRSPARFPEVSIRPARPSDSDRGNERVLANLRPMGQNFI